MNIKTNLAAASGGALAPPSPSSIDTPSRSGASTPERIRFKAFPYSGVNDYMMFCETGFLSLGGGYVLFLDMFFFFFLERKLMVILVMDVTVFGWTLALRRELAPIARPLATNLFLMKGRSLKFLVSRSGMWGRN
jgi:hypothetical protein